MNEKENGALHITNNKDLGSVHISRDTLWGEGGSANLSHSYGQGGGSNKTKNAQILK